MKREYNKYEDVHQTGDRSAAAASCDPSSSAGAQDQAVYTQVVQSKDSQLEQVFDEGQKRVRAGGQSEQPKQGNALFSTWLPFSSMRPATQNVYKPGAAINGFLLRDVATYVGVHQDMLVEDFFMIQSGRFRFCFIAMLLPILWPSWRRIWVLTIVQSVLLISFGLFFGWAIGLLMASSVGALYAKRLYSRQIARDLTRIGAHGRSDEANPQMEHRIAQAGKPSYLAGCLGALLLVALTTVILLFPVV